MTQQNSTAQTVPLEKPREPALTTEEKIDIAAERILQRFLHAFRELAK